MSAERMLYSARNPNLLAPLLVEVGRAPLWETDAIALRRATLAGGDFWPAAHADEIQMCQRG